MSYLILIHFPLEFRQIGKTNIGKILKQKKKIAFNSKKSKSNWNRVINLAYIGTELPPLKI